MFQRATVFAAVAVILALLVASATACATVSTRVTPGTAPATAPVAIIPSQVTINYIQMLSSTEGWAVGSQGIPTSPVAVGVILRYSQGRWSAVRAIPRATLAALSMDGPNDGWAIGTDYSQWQAGTRDAQGKVVSLPGGAATLMLHYSQGVWTRVTGVPGTYPNAITMFAPDNGWAADSQKLFHYDGTRWSFVPVYTATGQPLGATNIVAVSRTEGWAVGSYTAIALHYTGGQWRTVQEGPHPSLGALSLVSASEGWAVGAGAGSKAGVATFAHLHNWAWSLQTFQGLEGLRDVSMASVDDGWAVGGASAGLLMHYAGSHWLRVAAPTPEPLMAVRMVSANDGWAAGNRGTLLRYQGGAWKPQTWDVTLENQPLPVIAQPSSVNAPAPTLDPNFHGLTLNGDVTGQLRPIQTTCVYNEQAQPGSYGVTVLGTSGDASYTLSMSTGQFTGPGTYVGKWFFMLHGLLADGSEVTWQLAPASGTGTVTINTDERSGMVDAQLTQQDGAGVRIVGAWATASPCDNSLG